MSERQIAELLISLGFKPNHRGYRYALTALKQIQSRPELLDRKIYTALFPAVAEKYGANPKAIDRCLRTCMETCQQTGTEAWLRFADTYWHGDDRPTVGRFLATVSEVVRLGMTA
jgi:hypothetical protein